MDTYALDFGHTFEPLPKNAPQRGDVNGDGVFDIGDLAQLAKAVAGWDLSSDAYYASAADCDGDGSLGVGDVTRLAKFLAGWSVTLG